MIYIIYKHHSAFYESFTQTSNLEKKIYKNAEFNQKENNEFIDQYLYLHSISNGDTAVLHCAMDISFI